MAKDNSELIDVNSDVKDRVAVLLEGAWSVSENRPFFRRKNWTSAD